MSPNAERATTYAEWFVRTNYPIAPDAARTFVDAGLDRAVNRLATANSRGRRRAAIAMLATAAHAANVLNELERAA